MDGIYGDYITGRKVMKEYLDSHDISADLDLTREGSHHWGLTRNFLSRRHIVLDRNGDSAWLWLGQHEMRQLFETGTFDL